MYFRVFGARRFAIQTAFVLGAIYQSAYLSVLGCLWISNRHVLGGTFLSVESRQLSIKTINRIWLPNLHLITPIIVWRS
jgi:cell shape-determining protein MreD